MTSAMTKEFPKPFLHFVVSSLTAVLTIGGCASFAMQQSQAQSTSLPQPSVIVEVNKSPVYVVDAYVEDSILTGDDIIHPDTISDTFLKVSVSNDGSIPLKQQNIRLLYQDIQFEVFMWGWVTDNDGKPTGVEYIFVVPSSSEFSDFKLQLAENTIVELSSFFK
jgi:hypothetical protein